MSNKVNITIVGARVIGPEVTVGPLSRPARHRGEYGGVYQPESVFFQSGPALFSWSAGKRLGAPPDRHSGLTGGPSGLVD